MKPFRAEDLFHHHTITSLEGSGAHARLVFKLGRALKSSDGYERTLWQLDASDDSAPRQLTSVEFGASTPKWDPQGKRLAFLSKRGDRGMQVHLLREEGGEAIRSSDAEERLSSIQDWSRNGKSWLVLASTDWKEDGEDNESPDGGRPPQVARYLPYKLDGSGITVGERTHAYAIDVESGEIKALTEGDFDVSKARWSPDGKRLVLLRNRSERQRHRTDVWIADADGQDARRLVGGLASIGTVEWSPDSRWLLAAGSQEEGDSMTRLWRIDPNSGDLRRLGDDDFEIDPVTGIRWHPDSTRAAVVSSRRGLQVVAVVDLRSGDATHRPFGLRHVLALSLWGDRIAFVAASMRAPEELYSMEWDGTDVRRHTAFNRTWFRKRTRPRALRRRFDVPDGNGGEERIDAWLLRPAKGDGPFPLLVDMHGGPHSTVLIDFAAHTYWYELCSKGWAVLAPNAVGSGSYGERFSHRLRGRWGELDLPQIEAIVRRLQREGFADDRVACTGKSYGGYLSAWACGHSDLFRAVIACAPIANLESHFGTSDTGYYVTPFAMAGEYPEQRDRYHALSPIAYCANTKAAVLILQGENDGRCPRGQAEELFAHLIRCTDVPIELVVYPTSSHSEAESGRPSNRVDYHARIARWAAKHAGSK